MDAPLYQRFSGRIPALARKMICTFHEEIPIYALLPREQLEGEVLAICEQNLRIFAATLVEERLPDEQELSEFRSSAARRAQERVPLASVLAAYHVGGRLMWGEMCALARPEESAELLASVDVVQHYIQIVTAEVATSYLSEQQAISGEERDAQRALVAALVSGEPAEALGARVGRRLPSSWTVLAVDLAAHPDETTAGAVAARRKVRRVQQHLDARAGEPVLSRLEACGGLVLLPDHAAWLPGLADLVADLQVVVGAEVRVAAAPAARTSAIAAAAAQAQEVLRLAGDEPRLYVLRDVLLDYQLTRSGDAQHLLADLLTPLDAYPDLSLTLDAYLTHDLDRRRAAAALYIHPNTLDYRLKRLTELTGLELTTTCGLQLLTAAVAVRRNAPGHGQRPES